MSKLFNLGNYSRGFWDEIHGKFRNAGGELACFKLGWVWHMKLEPEAVLGVVDKSALGDPPILALDLNSEK